MFVVTACPPRAVAITVVVPVAAVKIVAVCVTDRAPIGGLGVAGAVRAWLGSRMPVIATLKCLGAPSRLIFRIYLLQVMLIAGLGVLLGVFVAAVAPVFTIDLLSSYVTVPIAVSVYPLPLAIAAGFGMVTSFMFALWPLAKAEEVRAANLFRRLSAIPAGRPRPRYLVIALADDLVSGPPGL